MLVQDAVKAPRLVDIPLDPIFDLLRRVAHEVVRLALHGPDAAVLEEEPVINLIMFLCTAGIAVLVPRVVFGGQVLQDGAGFEEADRAAAVEGVGQGRDAAVGVDLEEPGVFLRVGPDVDVDGFVGEAEQGEHDRDFDAVGGLVRVEG